MSCVNGQHETIWDNRRWCLWIFVAHFTSQTDKRITFEMIIKFSKCYIFLVTYLICMMGKKRWKIAWIYRTNYEKMWQFLEIRVSVRWSKTVVAHCVSSDTFHTLNRSNFWSRRSKCNWNQPCQSWEPAEISHNLKYLNMKPTQLNKYNFLFIEIQWQYLHGLCRRQLLTFFVVVVAVSLHIVLVRMHFSSLLMWHWQVNLWFVFGKDNKMRYAWRKNAKKKKLHWKWPTLIWKRKRNRFAKWKGCIHRLRYEIASCMRVTIVLSILVHSILSLNPSTIHTFFLLICAEKKKWFVFYPVIMN